MDPFTLIAGVQAGSSILGGLIGNSAAKKAAKQATAAQAEGLNRFNTQADRAEGFANTGADRAISHVTPYAEAGGDALGIYRRALGVDGRGPQQAYYDEFQDDPGFQHALDTGLHGVEHSRVVRGSSNSGAAAKELFAFGENARLGAYRDRLDRLSSLSQIGLQAGTTAAGIETGRGSTLADIALKRGTAGRDAALGTGNAQAGATLQQGNNLTNMISGVATAGMIGAGGKDAFQSLYGQRPIVINNPAGAAPTAPASSVRAPSPVPTAPSFYGYY